MLPPTVLARIPPSSLVDLQVSGFAERLLPTGAPAAADDADLAAALDAYAREAQPDELGALEEFLATHPDSPWRVALLTNLGLVYYHYGYFSRAIDAWERAWAEGQGETDSAVTRLVDRAVGELLRMHARLGHADRLDALLKEVGERTVTGPATEALTGAKEGLWSMRNDPGVAYLCGPKALKNLLLTRGTDPAQTGFLDAYRSPQGGVTLREVARLADQAHLAYTLVQRRPGEPLPVPAVVHWRVGHFAAIVGEAGDRLQVKDPTFGTDLWITRRALDAEASGYFLVPRETAAGMPWREIDLSEAETLRGMGNTGNNEPGATTPKDETECDRPCNAKGLVQYDVHSMLVSLNLRDTPVGYRPARGPSAEVTFTYNQREAYQPATFGYFNVGPKWTLNWLSYIQDDPLVPGASVLRSVAGGGAVNYGGYNAASGAFTPETRDAAVLVRLAAPDGSISYERRLADGGKEVYARSDSADRHPRRLFLTKVIDPAGNAVTLNHDDQLRLKSFTDATDRRTTFQYALADKPLLITAVTDPFGRRAKLDYDTSGRLIRITDVLGMASEFTYDAGTQITAMTTPYGTTSFAASGDGNSRRIEITDPLGAKEVVVYGHNTPGVPNAESVVPSGLTAPVANAYLSYRNTAYWSKQAQAQAPGDYTQARIKHWTHAPDGLKTWYTLESIKQPLERRVWFSYPGQESNLWTSTLMAGSFDQPSALARVLDDGSTQLIRYDYNAKGRVTRAIDPMGRQTRYSYADNGIDLLRVTQVTAAGEETLAEITWNAQHQPLSARDAAGQVTQYTYNAAGQVVSVTDALGQVTAFSYDAVGQLTRIVNPAGRTALAFSYDGFGRVASRTDSEGYTVTYGYDALDRVTTVGYPDGSRERYAYNKLDPVSFTD
jgi:YD repeat-containing protein